MEGAWRPNPRDTGDLVMLVSGTSGTLASSARHITWYSDDSVHHPACIHTTYILQLITFNHPAQPQLLGFATLHTNKQATSVTSWSNQMVDSTHQHPAGECMVSPGEEERTSLELWLCAAAAMPPSGPHGGADIKSPELRKSLSTLWGGCCWRRKRRPDALLHRS